MVSSRSHDLILKKRDNFVIFIKAINSFEPTILILRIYPTDTQSHVYTMTESFVGTLSIEMKD